MNAKELMVGDIVGMKNDDNSFCFIKVGEIEKSRIWGYFPREISMDGILYEDLHPIPLTEEILVANGFTFSFDSFWSFCKNDFERIILRFCKENEDMTENTFSYFKNHWIFDENYRIDYVHELQHAIRICGLGELADNFTVKEYAE